MFLYYFLHTSSIYMRKSIYNYINDVVYVRQAHNRGTFIYSAARHMIKAKGTDQQRLEQLRTR